MTRFDFGLVFCTFLRHLQRLAAAAVAGVLLLLATQDKAYAWPDRPVRIITLAGAGGSSDAVVRLVAEELTRKWGKPVVVENKPGADGIIAVETFLSSRDGHTLLFASTGIVTANPLLHARLSYDPARDLVPLTLVVEDFIAVATSPHLAPSLVDLVKLARERREPLNYASVPGPPYLFSLALQHSTNVKMMLIPYRNPLSSIQDLTAARIEVAILPLATVLGLAQSGRLSLLAVTNPQRAPSAPTVPTVGELGFNELSFLGGLGFFAASDMSAGLREAISNDVRQIVAEPATRRRLEEMGYVVRGHGPAEFQAMLRDQNAKWSDLARAYHISPTD